MRLNSGSKRIAIYFIYDKQGIVDDYIIYQLNDLKKNLDYLLVVVNGILSVDGRKKLKPLADKIIVRENKGFDVWAYKTGIEDIGWDKLNDFDELLLMNFTCFGPLYPFSEAFTEMNSRDIDFWGLTKHNQVPFDPFGTIEYGFIPAHIQSSFICVRKNMFNDDMFKNWWTKMPMINSYGDSVGKHEAIFTKKFEDAGFNDDLYVKTDDLGSNCTNYPLMFYPKELIANRRCPVFKRKSFTNFYDELFYCTCGEATIEMYNYIRDHFDYDLNMVWDNLLRIENMADIKLRMHLNYILPKNHLAPHKKTRQAKVALVFHFYFLDLLEETMSYINNMPEYADIYITTDTEEKERPIMQELEKTNYKFKVIIIENRGRDVSSLLIGVRDYIFDYDVVCFAHDKKTTQIKPYSIGKSFAYKCLENVLGSKEFVENIVSTFEDEERLGILMPPPPYHGSYESVLNWEWTNNFAITKKLLEDLEINVNIDESKMPVSPLGTMFWFRPPALKPLYKKNWQYSDFPLEPNQVDATILHAVERAYGFVAQSAGFYSGWLLNDKFAAIELTNYHYMACRYKKQNQVLQSQINALKNSFSWEITKPLRLTKRIVKKLCPKLVWKLLRKIRGSLR
ncbi:MAG: rhamnan synthesis F family protein [Spirochaetaceae bacterium]|jgi:rhamnosyltransferase|nr:rhamnan synthesis F family protein [Spirochaetaceae bacterium]